MLATSGKIVRDLRSKDPKKRLAAADSVAKWENPRSDIVVDALVAALSDDHSRVRRTAARALRAITGRHGGGDDQASWRRWLESQPETATDFFPFPRQDF
jgi:hypothetical protein